MKNRVDWLWSACVFPQENVGLRSPSSPAAPASFFWPFCECVYSWGQLGHSEAPKTKAPSASKWPLEIKRGNITVNVYRRKEYVNGTTYQQFTVVYHAGAQRKKKRFADLKKAHGRSRRRN
jgi:hypothetical protein